MKRHGFTGQGASHGAQARAPSSRFHRWLRHPGRVFKGTRMSGRMGNDRVTTQNLVVHKVDAENGVLLIKGAIPGRNGGLVMVRSAIKTRREVNGGAANTLKIDVHTPGGKKDGSVELPAELFDVEANIALMHQVVDGASSAAARQGTHSTKTRGEVRGGGKPYRQKGTGRARQGSTARAAVHRRWRRARPEAARLQPAHAQEDDRRRAARRCRTGRATAASTPSPSWWRVRPRRPRAPRRSWPR